MMSSNGNSFLVTGPLWGKYTNQSSNTGIDVFFDVSLNKRLNKQRVAGDLRHQIAHYDVTVMDMHCLYNGLVLNRQQSIYSLNQNFHILQQM